MPSSLPYVCLDNYEGIILRKNSTMLDGAILRGLRTCIGIVVESENFIIIMHHPGFKLSSTFEKISEWTNKIEFGEITAMKVYKNFNYPTSQGDSLQVFCTELKNQLMYHGDMPLIPLRDAEGIFQINKNTAEIVKTLELSKLKTLESRELLLNAPKTVGSRAHYLTARLAYHSGNFDACSIKIMTRVHFTQMPLQHTLAPEIQRHIAQLHDNINNVAQLAIEISSSSIWANVLDLDIPTQASVFIARLQNYFMFLLELSPTLDREIKQCVVSLSKQKEILMSMVPVDNEATMLLRTHLNTVSNLAAILPAATI